MVGRCTPRRLAAFAAQIFAALNSDAPTFVVLTSKMQICVGPTFVAPTFAGQIFMVLTFVVLTLKAQDFVEGNSPYRARNLAGFCCDCVADAR